MQLANSAGRVPMRVAVLALAFVAACGDGEGRQGVRDSVAASPLKSAAEEVASFLSGNADFEVLRVADSVDLYVAPEGGGGHARVPRERLRDRNAWRVGSGASARSFVPSGLLTKMTAHVGSHVNCQPGPLDAKFPQLASHPHVGVRLSTENERSCLEGWNATFIFDTTGGGKPKLTAAAYDQWEW